MTTSTPLASVLQYWRTLGFRWLALPEATRQREQQLRELQATVQRCRLCPLHPNRRQAVLGVGDPWSPMLFVGEGPGAQEDIEGQPFVGAAGQLLTKALWMVGIDRRRVYIANVVKCRPSENRTPRPSEMSACFPYLRRQIEILRPALLVPMGNPAMSMILGRTGIQQWRGQWFQKNGVWVVPIYHPAYVLRNPEAFPLLLNDLRQIAEVARHFGWL
jgi:uracil-DNA glycosylase family 4